MKTIDKNRKPEPPPTESSSTPADEISPDDIAFAAYCLWERDGRPDGRDQEHWFRAEKLLRESHARQRQSPRAPGATDSPAR
jgi:hypothetical protein